MKRTNSYILLTAAAASLIACSGCSSRPAGVMSEDDFATLLTDFYVSEAYTNLESTSSMQLSSIDSTRKVLRQSAMKNRGITQADFDSTLAWYGHNLDKYNKVCEKVIEQLHERQRGSIDEPGLPADAGSLWTGPLAIRFTEAGQGISLDIEPTLTKGDRLTWEFIPHNQTAPLDALIAVDYTDGSTAYAVRSLAPAQRSQQLNLQTDSALTPKRVYGYIRSRQPQPLILDSIKVTTAPLNPSIYYEVNTLRRFIPKK